MARRKRQFLDDSDDSDSDASGRDVDMDVSQDPDAREERALFEDPYKRKRRRVGGKEDAIYGVFGDDDDEDTRPRKRSDWTKAPAFTSAGATKLEDEEIPQEESSNDEQDEDATAPMDEDEEDFDGGDAVEGSDLEDSKPASPRIRDEEEEEDDRPRFGGLGAARATLSSAFTTPSSTVETPARGGIGAGSQRAGLGMASAELPSAFGKASQDAKRQPQRSFLRDTGSAETSRPATPLTAAERAHFSKLEGSYGDRIMRQMGWQAGSGLGATGQGIVNPIQTKVRPGRMGLGGISERTEQAITEEARKLGKTVAQLQQEKKGQKSQKDASRSDAWKKPKKARKIKVEHKTYEEILQESGSPAPSGIGIIIDATGATPREISSLAEAKTAVWTPTLDSTRIPEVRHNLREIVGLCKGEIEGLAREAKALEERKKWVKHEDARLRKKMTDEAQLIARLQTVHIAVDAINVKAQELASLYEASLDSFAPHIERLLNEFPAEYDAYKLDEIVVAAISPLVRRKLASWQPLEDPELLADVFSRWRPAFKFSGPSTVDGDTAMSSYESLMWNAWLPRVRAAVNNDWTPDNPAPVSRLLEVWIPLLPAFIRDNVIDQLILPKVHRAISDWKFNDRGISLQALVFPWLPHLGLRLDDFLTEAKRKAKGMLRGWKPKDGVPADFLSWKEVYSSADWEDMLLKNVVPKLGATLREDFQVNPRNQQMEPLLAVLQWAPIIRPSTFSSLLELEFFPKWLDKLHLWLIQPQVSFEQVAEWYSFWKGTFPSNVLDMPNVMAGFQRGLQMMNQAIELGKDAPTKLPKPDHFKSPTASPAAAKNGKLKSRSSAARTTEITFKSLVEEFAGNHNLLFMPTGKVHEKSRMPLFRVSPNVDGKGGLLVYLLDDAVWTQDGDDYRPVSLDDMVLRATKKVS